MIIRKAKKEGLNVISKIFAEESAKPPYNQKWTDKTALNKFREGLRNQDIFAIELERKIIGLITFNKTSDKKKRYLDEFWIKKECQGQGFGKEVMKFVERFYKSKGVKKIELVANRRANAFRFYKKLNYTEDNDLVFMNKKI